MITTDPSSLEYLDDDQRTRAAAALVAAAVLRKPFGSGATGDIVYLAEWIVVGPLDETPEPVELPLTDEAKAGVLTVLATFLAQVTDETPDGSEPGDEPAPPPGFADASGACSEVSDANHGNGFNGTTVEEEVR